MSTAHALANSQETSHAAHDPLAPVFAQYPLEVLRGEGVWLIAPDGRRVLDLYGGHAVASLGYGHPAWTKAVSEQALLSHHPAGLSAAVMTVPHHGSKTSSTPGFIAAVAARDVIFPVGYRNRFGHPKEEVVARYLESGARLHRTDADGAVGVSLAAVGIGFRHERTERRRYWHAGRR